MTRWQLRCIAAAATLVAAVCFPATSGGSVTPLLPNLKAQPAYHLRIESTAAGRFLRFSTTTWNAGTGPVELIGGEVDATAGTQRVRQRVFNSDGTFVDYEAGRFEWHPAHGHIHFDDYALYTLQPLSAPGGSSRTASKTTFCIIDTDKMAHLAGSPKRAVYTTCGQRQGMSVGWGDTYGYYLAGQEIDVGGLADGDYRLTIEADWKNHLLESDDTDNSSSVTIRITGDTVSVLGGRKHNR
jgi:lysyl oxidase